jgi:multidrug efflux pump subunit AcrA (membrane-fusion protein)
VPHAAADPLYRREVDDPDGEGRERLLVQPVVGLDGHVHAAIVAVRGAAAAPFGSAELASAEELATAWSPYLQQLAMSVEADEILGDQLDQGPSDLFRQEVIVSLMRRGARGDVVRVHPAWVRSAYWIVLASLLGVVAFAALARVHQYAEGPAIVLFTGRSEVIAQQAGTIESVEVARGQAVAQGQVIARLDEGPQAERLTTLQREFDQRLVEYMQTPSDPRIVAALTQARTERETARSAIKARAIVAPRAGVIKELVVRTGQRVEPGKPVAAVVERGASEGLSIYAFLPGGSRSRLTAGQRLVLSLPGYRGALITTTVIAASQEVLSAGEARARFLGPRYADSVPIAGTVAVVQATLATPEFEADGERYQLYDGMVGHAEVQLASTTILESLAPGWR